MLRHIDLCSGIGGFALGFEWAGLSRPVLFCDIEPWSRKVLAKHWPNVPIANDVKVLANDPERNVPDCDILTAGYPCTPFSVAGKQKGTDDDRHIWPYIFRIVAQKRPTWCVFENVYGHVALGLDQVLADLEAEGYATRTFIVPACGVDAPHRRDRLWIVAYCNSSGQQQSNKEMARQPSKQFDSGGVQSRKNVAYANSDRTERDKSENRQGGGVVKSSADVAHADNKRSQGRLSGGKNAERQSEHGHTGCSSAVHRQPTQDWRTAEPPVGRVGNGIPSQLDRFDGWEQEPADIPRVATGIKDRVSRLKGLGNAIVPAVAQRIGETIKAVHYG